MLALCQLVTAHGHAFVLGHAEFWIYPTQTILCGALLLWFWRCYEFHGLKNVGFTLLIALAVFVLWIAPQQFFHFAAHNGIRSGDSWEQSCILLVHDFVSFSPPRCCRSGDGGVFWRGFLLRFVIDEYFERVPFGKFTWLSFAIVALAFTFSHSRADWLAAFVAGALYNFVAYRTRSLASCVLAHAATNLLLGFWIMHTHQWGFW